MDVNDIIIRNKEALSAVIVHSTEDALGKNVSDYIQTKLDSAITVQVEEAASYKDLIYILENTKSFNVFILIAHGDKATHSAWLFADLDEDGNELSLGTAEQATLRDYLKDKVCIFGVCYFGAERLANALVGHDGAIFALASKPQNSLTGANVAKASVSLLNAMEHSKHSNVDLQVLLKHCVPQIDSSVLDLMAQFHP